MSVVITTTGLKKVFNRRVIFQDISFSLKNGDTLLVTGRNGSGKSTLLKIIARVLTPTDGSMTVMQQGEQDAVPLSQLFGFVSPYLNLYDEFSAHENLSFALSIRGLEPALYSIDDVLKDFGLEHVRNTPARVFSSGMKQRLKYAFAVIHRPAILVLDEPMANLDMSGKQIVRTLMAAQRESGVLIVATNEAGDVDHHNAHINLDG